MRSSRRTRKRERYQPGKIKKEKRNGTNLNDLRGTQTNYIVATFIKKITLSGIILTSLIS